MEKIFIILLFCYYEANSQYFDKNQYLANKTHVKLEIFEGEQGHNHHHGKLLLHVFQNNDPSVVFQTKILHLEEKLLCEQDNFGSSSKSNKIAINLLTKSTEDKITQMVFQININDAESGYIQCFDRGRSFKSNKYFYNSGRISTPVTTLKTPIVEEEMKITLLNVTYDNLTNLTYYLSGILKNKSLTGLQKNTTRNKLLIELDKELINNFTLNQETGHDQSIASDFTATVEDIAITSSVGLAVLNNNETNSFQELKDLKSESDASNIMNFLPSVAIKLPNYLIEAQKKKNKTKLATLTFANNYLFPTMENFQISTIISTTFGIEKIKNLTDPVKIWFRRNSSIFQNAGLCVAWDFTLNNGLGNWSTEGCEFKKTYDFPDNSTFKLDECWCFHLTHFGEMFIDHSSNQKINSMHQLALNIITHISSVISLAGVLVIITTAIFIKHWINSAGHQLQLQITLNYALLIIIFNLMNYLEFDKIIGKLFGVILHYLILSNCTWLLLAAGLQYLRLVKIFPPTASRLPLKIGLCGWILPAIPPLILLLVNLILKSETLYGTGPLYLPTKIAFYCSVILPLVAVMIFNLVMFSLIAYNLFRASKVREHNINKSKSMIKFRQLIFLFVIFGLGWAFALGQQSTNITFATISSYLFTIAIGLQGFMYFLYFIVLDRKTITAWKCKIEETKHELSSKDNSTSFTSFKTSKQSPSYSDESIKKYSENP